VSAAGEVALDLGLDQREDAAVLYFDIEHQRPAGAVQNIATNESTPDLVIESVFSSDSV
jgi:hypothetical protein